MIKIAKSEMIANRKLLAENKDFRKALEFYKDSSNWLSRCGNFFIGDMEPSLSEKFQGWVLDGCYGKIAETVLNKYKRKK